MKGGVGDLVRFIARPKPGRSLLQPFDRRDQGRGHGDGVEQAGRKGRMPRPALADHLHGDLALVTRGQLHGGRLADDAGDRSRRLQRQRLQHGAYADAADLLIAGKGQVQRDGQPAFAGEHGRPQGAGEKALHVGSSAPVKPVPLAREAEGLDGPGLPLRGHDIGVPGQDHAAAVFRSDGCEQIEVAGVRTFELRHPGAGLVQHVAYEADHRAVRLQAHSRKADKLFQEVQAVHANAHSGAAAGRQIQRLLSTRECGRRNHRARA